MGTKIVGKLEVPIWGIDTPGDLKTIRLFHDPDPRKAIQVPPVCLGWLDAKKYIVSTRTTAVLHIQCDQPSCARGEAEIRRKCGL